MIVTGDNGKLTAGGRMVAALRMWRLETGPEGYRLEARLESPNRWLLTFAPAFDVALPVGSRTIYYQGVGVEVAENEVVITGGERRG